MKQYGDEGELVGGAVKIQVKSAENQVRWVVIISNILFNSNSLILKFVCRNRIGSHPLSNFI